jgi:hypothetical protein
LSPQTSAAGTGSGGASAKDPAGQGKTPSDQSTSDDFLEANFRASEAEFNQRVLARAGSALSPDQVTALRKAQEQMIQFQDKMEEFLGK